MTDARRSTISKTLSANDTGETGTHQAGMLVPKRPDILSFFPRLDQTERNPRRNLRFRDASGQLWDLVFIYYNNALFGGTRNEYRLTCMTPYIRRYRLHQGDEIVLTRDASEEYSMDFRRSIPPPPSRGRQMPLPRSWKVDRQ